MANNIPKPEVWNVQHGGLASDEDLDARNGVEGSEGSKINPPRGIFGAFPGATPKYATNTGEQEKDFRETMARMFIQTPNYKKFTDSFLGSDTWPLAKVIGGSASEQSGTSGGKGYIDFLLQSVQHNYQEKSQVVETLADDHVAYFFGQAAPVFSYGGSLFNTKQDAQAANMYRLYRDMGRGSQLAAKNTLISIRYDGLIVSGAMMNLSLGLNAEMEMVVPFTFNLLVKQVVLLPTPDAGIVLLSKPFAAPGDKYFPFSTGALSIATKPTSPAAVPPAGSQIKITPPASAETGSPTTTPPTSFRGTLRESNAAK